MELFGALRFVGAAVAAANRVGIIHSLHFLQSKREEGKPVLPSFLQGPSLPVFSSQLFCFLVTSGKYS